MTRFSGTAVVLAALPGQARAPFLDRATIERHRDARVRRLVAFAGRTVPHYRDLFRTRHLDPRAVRTTADLAAFPMLDRDEVRREPARFVSESASAADAIVLRTSGSTGTPLEVRHDPRSVLTNIAYGERERAVVIGLAGGSFRPRELYLGYDTSNFRRILDFYARHTWLPRPRRTSVDMTSSFETIVDAIERVQPDVIVGYGTFIDEFFTTVAARGVDLHRPRVVMYVGETLPPERRAWIERTFETVVLSRYCAVESFKIAYVCEHRTGFHVHEDLCHVRVVAADGRDAGVGQLGEVVITNLVNRATVLINYPMGDVAALADGRCPCGRTHRVMTELDGRLEDQLRLADGRSIHPRAIWALFKDDRHIRQYQVIQHTVRRLELRLAIDEAAPFASVSERAAAGVRRLLGGDVEVTVTKHDELGREARGTTGKFRAVESRVAAVRRDG